jgi:WD40 repeat protein
MSHFEGPLRVLFEIDGQEHDHSARTLYRWDPMNRFLVTVGGNNRVNVYRRDGELVHQFPMSTTSSEGCADIRWDKDGQCLAILQKNTSQIMLWSMQNMHEVHTHTHWPSCGCTYTCGCPVHACTFASSLSMYMCYTLFFLPLLHCR